jgi:hypothetical protein
MVVLFRLFSLLIVAWNLTLRLCQSQFSYMSFSFKCRDNSSKGLLIDGFQRPTVATDGSVSSYCPCPRNQAALVSRRRLNGASRGVRRLSKLHQATATTPLATCSAGQASHLRFWVHAQRTHSSSALSRRHDRTALSRQV